MSSWDLRRDKANTIVVRKPEVLARAMQGSDPMFKPLVEVYKPAHGMVLYNCKVFDVAAGLVRSVQFLLPSDSTLIPMEGQYGQQVLCESEESFMDALEAVLDIWRTEVAKKSATPSDTVPIESVPALRGGAVYASWNWKSKEVFAGVEALVNSGQQATLMLNGVTFNKAKNSVTAKLALSQFPYGMRRRLSHAAPVAASLEILDTQAEEEKSGASSE